MVHKKENER
jgi:hypothetical protein